MPDEVVGRRSASPRRASCKTMSDGRVAGPVAHVQLAVAQLARGAVLQRASDVHRAAPAAERAETPRAARGATSSGMPCSRMISVGEVVVLLDRLP